MLVDPVSEFGTCWCGGQYSKGRRVELRITTDEGEISLTDVPQGACAMCDGRAYKLADIAGLDGILLGRWLAPVAGRAS